jgi:hypothetical protein
MTMSICRCPGHRIILSLSQARHCRLLQDFLLGEVPWEIILALGVRNSNEFALTDR